MHFLLYVETHPMNIWKKCYSVRFTLMGYIERKHLFVSSNNVRRYATKNCIYVFSCNCKCTRCTYYTWWTFWISLIKTKDIYWSIRIKKKGKEKKKIRYDTCRYDLSQYLLKYRYNKIMSSSIRETEKKNWRWPWKKTPKSEKKTMKLTNTAHYNYLKVLLHRFNIK